MVSYAFNVSAPAPYLSEGRCGDGLCLDSAAKIIISSEYRPDPSVFFKERRSFHRCTRPASCKSGSSVKCIDRNFKQLSASPPLLPVLLNLSPHRRCPTLPAPVPSVPSVPLCETIPRTPSDLHRTANSRSFGNRIPDCLGTAFPTVWEPHSRHLGTAFPAPHCQPDGERTGVHETLSWEKEPDQTMGSDYFL